MSIVNKQTIIRACAQSHVCSFYHNATGLRRCSTCSYDYCNNSGFVPSFLYFLGNICCTLQYNKIFSVN
ncbi:hypothetical protein NQ314_011636 [Rhamnusium bicolor]|uniref:Uncharacterized protein n=1 Tax=Rhamnusium bicolor TaxID=1586634 RepID=A0AAV8XIT7_9CUCU|nr:hypothetical protein NQ314_011636 [Rhamnusium bicolor]